MKKVLLLTLVFSSWFCCAQDVNWEKLDQLNPDLILQKERQPIPVLLLGTFHFNYPGLDGYKTAEEDKMDILSVQKQAELKELLEVLVQFNPTKIYIESFNQAYHDSLYSAYMKNNYTLGRNEIYQIGYRLAKSLNHEKLYAVDAGSFLKDLTEKSDNCLDTIYEGAYKLMNENQDTYWHQTYTDMYSTSEGMRKDLTLLENFIVMSNPAILKRMHGHYLSSGFNTVDNQGPDRLAMWWYTRNLRILNNILQTQPTKEDRILVLFGNGHMSILNHLFESMPQFEIKTLETIIKNND